MTQTAQIDSNIEIICRKPKPYGKLLLALAFLICMAFVYFSIFKHRIIRVPSTVDAISSAAIGSGVYSIEKDLNLFKQSLLKGGWSQPESKFVWMNAPEAHLSLNIGKDFTGTLTFDIAAFLPHPDSTQTASVYVNDRLAAQVKFNTGKNRQRVAVLLKDLTQDAVDVKFADPDVVSPKTAGISIDARTLGIQLWGLDVEK
jgi:hypothetical protein